MLHCRPFGRRFWQACLRPREKFYFPNRTSAALEERALVPSALLFFASAFLAGFVYSSFFEWVLHRFLMHRPLGFFRYPFRAHALTHHQTFGGKESYHLLDPKNRKVIRMAWWNAPLLLALHAPLALLASQAAGSWWVGAGFLAAFLSYYGLYEYFHWCMHVPQRRWFQSTRLFRWVDGHHRMHHIQPTKNLNVVLPLADVVFRTRLAWSAYRGQSQAKIAPVAKE